LKQAFLLAILLLTTATQAGVFKCKAPNGFVYSEKPCPDGDTAGPGKVIPASGDPINKVQVNVTPPKTNGVVSIA
jgi:hypothetical protein